ncbi:pyruvate dehydrogenase complex dihydrolipoamide acetyltransferase [Amylibacter sp.]|nr:pyruvate dehydrogenase complex dihydrolipoamide acetyltransferase [Amylibacter sp.]MDC1270021.1 pyruvate dehydrogenase complex dihydrolipoamide acetyltransferase [Amylibacter sp.]MDC1414590.1 pyruvate dehydrogenase complex dihydrolipoamide acetyltransferase [Amylibacter sp.]
MPINIQMPALSPTMEEGTLTKWLIKEGDTVESGDIMAEIETDKATMEFEAVDEGIIGKIIIPEGTTGVKVNEIIAILLEDGEDASSIEIQEDIKLKNNTNDEVNVTNTEIKEIKADVIKSNSSADRVFATPLARRIAKSKDLDLNSINGSGPYGRIVKADVEVSISLPSKDTVTTTMAKSASSETIKSLYKERVFIEIELDGMRKVIANRLTEAKQTIPHFYLRKSVNLDKLLKIRTEMNEGLADKGTKISVNDFIIKASSLALQDVPKANVVWAEDRILQMKASDVAVAVSVKGGLFTPVIFDSENKSLSSLSSEIKDLASRARDRKLLPSEYQGGSFAISNLGMMGVENFDAVINPPHGSILAVGAGVKKPIVLDDGSVSVATIMSLTLSVDHRAIDGALGAEFLSKITQYLENPLTMLV